MAKSEREPRARELHLVSQVYSPDPLSDRETDLYRGEYIMDFVGKWDQLIGCSSRTDHLGSPFSTELGDVLWNRYVGSIVRR